MISLIGVDWWPIRNTCLCRLLSCTQLQMGRGASEFTTQQSRWLIWAICLSSTWTRVQLLSTGRVVPSPEQASIKAISNPFKHSYTCNCKTCVGHKRLQLRGLVRNRHQESYQRCSSIWPFTCMACSRHRWCRLSHRCQPAVSTSTWLLTWNSRWTAWVRRRLCPRSIHRSTMWATRS